MNYEPELRDLEADDAHNRAARARVNAAANALAQQWADTPHDVRAIAEVMRNDAWTLEHAGLLANPEDTQ